MVNQYFYGNMCIYCLKGVRILTCLICNREKVHVENILFDSYLVICHICGTYIISPEAKEEMLEMQRIKIAAVMRERKVHSLEPVAIFLELPKEEVKDLSFPIITLEDLIRRFPEKISDRMDRILVNLTKSSRYPGDAIKITGDQKSLFFTQSNDISEMLFLMNQLVIDELITVSSIGTPSELKVTAKGWNRVAELEKTRQNDNNQAFVAMWFSNEMDSAFENGVYKAISKAGFSPIRIDRKEHNNKIDDEIIAEIKKSKFVVADFTGQRGGVYFEAGYAMGLGKQVIWTCRQDHLHELHFDTRQYSHIVWETEEELFQKLFNRIRATID